MCCTVVIAVDKVKVFNKVKLFLVLVFFTGTTSTSLHRGGYITWNSCMFTLICLGHKLMLDISWFRPEIIIYSSARSFQPRRKKVILSTLYASFCLTCFFSSWPAWKLECSCESGCNIIDLYIIYISCLALWSKGSVANAALHCCLCTRSCITTLSMLAHVLLMGITRKQSLIDKHVVRCDIVVCIHCYVFFTFRSLSSPPSWGGSM